MDGIYAHAGFDDLDFDARSQWVSKGKTTDVACSRQLKSIKHTTVGHFYVTLTLQTFIYVLTNLFHYHVNMPQREAGNLLCLPTVENLRAVI